MAALLTGQRMEMTRNQTLLSSISVRCLVFIISREQQVESPNPPNRLSSTSLIRID